MELGERTDRLSQTAVIRRPAQKETYQSAYQKWRCQEDQPYAFQDDLQQNAVTYIDGLGVRENEGIQQERRALRSTCLLLAVVVVMYCFAEKVLSLGLVLLLQVLGVNIGYSFQEHIPYGNEYAVLFVQTMGIVMKYLIPLCIVWSQVKMPAKVAMPMPIRSGWAAWAALGTFFIGFFAVSIFQLFVPMDIFMDHTIGDNFKVMDYMDTGCQTALLVVYLLISPILAEILLHGALFQVLRQFGAGFASLVVALLSAALSHDPVFFPTVFIISLVAGYGTWQSGSILTAIVVRICGKVVFYLMLQSGGFPSFGSLSGQVWFSLAVLLTGLVIGAFLLLFRKRRRTLRDRHTFLPTKTKAKMAALSTPMLVAWGGCLIMLALEVLS